MTRPIALILVLAMTAAQPATAQENEPATETTRDSGVVEQVETRLAQFQVVVTGPAEILAGLSKDHLELVVGGEPIEDFTVDRLRTSATPSGSRADPYLPATYVFYLDQPMLTPRGRDRSLGVCRELITRLVSGDDRGMIVSNGKELVIFAEPTSDRQVLLDALDRIDEDAEHMDTWATREQAYVDEIRLDMEELKYSGTFGAVPQASVSGRATFTRQNLGPSPDGLGGYRTPASLDPNLDSDRGRMQARGDEITESRWKQIKFRANTYETEGLAHSQRSLLRLQTLLSRLHEMDRPKSLLYFGDILRFQPGAMYSEITSLDNPKNTRTLREVDPMADPEAPPRDIKDFFDHVVAAATSQGVRFYPIEGEGLDDSTDHHAQNALVHFGLETGGQAFLRGADTEAISDRIRADLSSLFLLSFDPEGLKEDTPLSVYVRPRVPGLEVHTGGRIAVESEEARTHARLLAAHLDPDVVRSDINVGATLIPTGYSDGRFRALVQVSAPGSPLPRSSWEVGASIVTSGRVREEGSKQITVTGAEVPLTYEQEVSFAPGPFELIAVVHMTETGEIASRRIEGAWPDLDHAPAAIGPIAVIQPSQRVLVRGEETRTSGALAVGDNEAVRLDFPTAIVSLVCRHKKQKGTLRVDRNLVGASRADFEPVEIGPEDARCAVLSDMIPARTLGKGHFQVTVEVLCDGEPCASGKRTFAALEPGS
jgi:hypothetical protein